MRLMTIQKRKQLSTLPCGTLYLRVKTGEHWCQAEKRPLQQCHLTSTKNFQDLRWKASQCTHCSVDQTRVVGHNICYRVCFL